MLKARLVVFFDPEIFPFPVAFMYFVLFLSASVEFVKKCSKVNNGIWKRSPVAFPSQVSVISVISVTCLNNSSLLLFHAFKYTIFSKSTNNHKDWNFFGEESVEGFFLFLSQMLLVG